MLVHFEPIWFRAIQRYNYRIIKMFFSYFWLFVEFFVLKRDQE